MEEPKPDLVILPFKASIRDTGQPLTLAQASAMLARPEAEFVRIERSYPGSPEASGWTLFERTTRTYIYTGDPLFASERQTRQHLRQVYAIRHVLNGEDGSTYSHLHL